MKRWLRWLRWLVFCCCLIISIESLASIMVEPSRFEFVLDPLEKTTGAIKISNHSDLPLLIKVNAYDWSLDKNETLVTHKLGTTEHTLASYIKFNPKQFLLEPNKAQIVRFTITMPKDLPKERRTMVFFETAQTTISGNIQTVIEAQIGTVIYATSTDANASFKLADIQVNHDPNNSYIYLFCYNKGEVHVRAKLSYSLYGSDDKEFFSTTTNEYLLLPSSRSVISLPLPQQLNPGNYRLIGKFVFDGTQKTLPFVFSFTVEP